jgi:hypothetical protein
VLDGGTGFLKVGYAAQVRLSSPRVSLLSLGLRNDFTLILQNFPEHQFPSIVGRPILRTEEQAGDIVVKDIMCGDEAAAARSMLQISYPVCPHPARSTPRHGMLASSAPQIPNGSVFTLWG